jgi:16S rRNA G966 N2-methylase RsmD
MEKTRMSKISEEKHSKQKRLKLKKEDLRFATNELVADWRASRLACNKIADIGCGIGFQSMAFSKKCQSVIAIDIDKEKIATAKKNSRALNFRKIEFAQADALSNEAISLVNGCDIVFLDPHREAEADARSIDAMKPDIKEFLKKYEALTGKIAIEFPPQIKEIPFDCEREYTSVNGKLNRLTLYFGELKKSDYSAVALPKKSVLLKQKDAVLKSAGTPLKYLYEADPAVQKAGLLPELCESTGTALLHEKKNAFFTSEDLARSDFFRNSYRVIQVLEFDRQKVKDALRKAGAIKVLVRYEVAPEEYWDERNFFESGLSGNRQLALFNLDGIAVIAEKIS